VTPGLFRLLLATIVVVQHFSRVTLGTMAVYVFFALSGYWVSRMWNRKYVNCPFPYASFVASRFGRLLPTFLLVSALTFGGHWLASDLMEMNLRSILSSVWLLGYASIPGGGYVIPAWSLDIEMQFYLVAPLVLRAIALRRQRSTLLLLVASAGSLLFLGSHRATIFSNLLPYTTFFSIGIATSSFDWHPERRFATASIAATALSIMVLTIAPSLRGIILVGAHATPLARFNGPMCAVVAMIGAPFAMSTVWRHSPAWDRAAGELSYVLYLVHWPFVWSVDRYWGGLSVRDRLPVVAAALALTFAMSFLIWRYFDRPINRWRERYFDNPPRVGGLWR
jgi:peptidoglycan/LPS O-acetylase OafA/YrhL